jgi:hypothetical protein
MIVITFQPAIKPSGSTTPTIQNEAGRRTGEKKNKLVFNCLKKIHSGKNQGQSTHETSAWAGTMKFFRAVINSVP